MTEINTEMEIIEFLNNNNILWQPILLKDKVAITFPNGMHPKTNDYKNLSESEIKIRQKIDTEYIGIYTNNIQQIDIDCSEAKIKYEFLKDCPYFESITKKLPHYFVEIKDFNKEVTPIIGGDMLTGQWSYCRKNAIVYNYKNQIKTYKTSDFEIGVITKLSLQEKVQKLRQNPGPDCSYQNWSIIIQNLYNIASNHLFENPQKYAHDFSKDCNKYDSKAIKTIDNLTKNLYSNKTCLNKINSFIKGENHNQIREVEKESDEVNEENKVIFDFFENHKKLIFYCEDELWIKDDIYVWRNKDKIVDNLIYQYLRQEGYCILKAEKYTKSIRKEASRFCRDESFYQLFHTSTQGKICFENGVLNISDSKFFEWNTPETMEVYTNIMIEYYYKKPTQEIVDEIMRRVLLPIFNDNIELMKEHLNCISRSLCSHNDKYYSVWVGQRNSGKGILTALYQSAFPGYIGTFNANNLIKERRNNGENSRKDAWKIPFALNRIVIGNEMSINDAQFIDGIEIKQIASGGDTIIARVLYEQDREYKLQSHMHILTNDFNDIKPKDAYSNMLYIDMPCTFQEKESELAIRRDPDDTLKSWVQETYQVHLGIIEILLQNYGPKNYKIMTKMAEDMVCDGEDEGTIINKILELITITGNPDDRISYKAIDNLLKNNEIILTTISRKRYFTKMKIDSKKNSTWYYIGITVKLVE